VREFANFVDQACSRGSWGRGVVGGVAEELVV